MFKPYDSANDSWPQHEFQHPSFKKLIMNPQKQPSKTTAHRQQIWKANQKWEKRWKTSRTPQLLPEMHTKTAITTPPRIRSRENVDLNPIPTQSQLNPDHPKSPAWHRKPSRAWHRQRRPGRWWRRAAPPVPSARWRAASTEPGAGMRSWALDKAVKIKL